MSLVRRYRRTMLARALKTFGAVWELEPEDVPAIGLELR
jgi:hypothetical protein